MSAATAVELLAVEKRFGATVAVHPMSLAIGSGEFFSLLGPSGCGKTTTLRMIAGFEHPTSGTIRMMGQDITDVPAHEREANMVFQNYALFPHLSVFENVAFGLRVRKLDKAEIDGRVQVVLDVVRLTGMERRKPGQLSGGQQQRVALARALVLDPKVLLLDEPLGALDQKLRKEMQLELKRIQREVGITFIYVTHDQEEALTMSDRIAVMNGGRVLQVDSPGALYDRPANRFVASFIGNSNFLSGRLAASEGGVAVVEVEGIGRLRATNYEDHPVGSWVTVMVRPERIRFDEEGPGANRVPAQVEDVTFVGNDTLYTVKLPDWSLLTVRRQNRRPSVSRPAPAVGRPIEVVWDVDGAILLSAEAST